MRHRYLPALLVLLLGFALAPSLSAQTYSHFYEVPGNVFLHDLTFHDGYVWAADRSSATGPRIIKIDPDNGQFVETIAVNVEFSITGLTFDGEHFWVSRTFTSSNNRIYKIDGNGNVVDDIPAPSPLSNGLAWYDGDLWVSRANPNDQAGHVRLDPADGTELSAISSPWTQPAGMAFIGDGTMWATNAGDDGTNIEKLYQLDLATGDLIQDLDMPDGIGRPRGLAFDGVNTLYMIAQTRPGATNYRLYVISLETAGNPQLLLSATAINFGTVLTDDVDDRTLILINDGNAELVIDNVALDGHEAFSTAFDGAGIAPGEQVSVVLTFDPVAYGPHDGSLSFTTNDVSQQEVTIPLYGFGLFPEQTAALAQDDHDFGSVRIAEPYGDDRSVRTWPLRIVNQGATDLTVENIETTGPFHVEQDLDLPLTVGAADTLTVLIGFRPLVVGAASGEVQVQTSDPDTPLLTASLSGTGVDPELEGGDTIWTLTIPDNPVTTFQDKKVTVIRPMSDVTGDGAPDITLATRNYWVLGIRGNSWQTAEILWSFNTCPNNFNCGSVSGVDGLYNTGLVAESDLNGDGYRDVVFGTGGGNDHVIALSGKDGSVIWAHGDENDPYLASYYAVSNRYDFNGDGVPDVVAGTGTASQNSPNPYNQRRVYLLSGATGEVLWVRQPNPLVPNFAVEQIMGNDGSPKVVAGGRNPDAGQAHITAYNADGSQAWSHSPITASFVMARIPREDGGEDIVYTGSGGFTANELVRLDGMTGDVVWEIQGLQTIWALDVVGDMTGSGDPDVVVGDFNGSVTVYDGANGAFVWSAGMPGQAFGVAAIGDVTLDGKAEIAVATSTSQIRLLSGEDGDTLWTYMAGNGNISQAGEVVAMIPDIDGNNAPEIAAGTRHGHVALLKSTANVLPTSDEGEVSPVAFRLHAPFPNPTAAGSTLMFELPETGNVRLAVYDLLGRQVAVLGDGEHSAGQHEVMWNGRGASGAPVAAGMYLVRLEAGRHAATQRILVLR